MAQGPPTSPGPPTPATPTGPLPVVRLELRQGPSRPLSYELADVCFLIGSVPGCDLRLPGVSLPPLLCLISRHPGGVTLRKLAPVQPILVNGRSVSTTALADGDRVVIGSADLLVRVADAPVTEADDPRLKELAQRTARLDERQEQLDRRQAGLEQQTQELEEDRVLWYRRREEIEDECKRQDEALARSRLLPEKERELAAAGANLEGRERALQDQRDELARRQEEGAR